MRLTEKEHNDLIQVLAKRFEQNMHRHKGLVWPVVQQRLEAQPLKLWSLSQMEASGGEPDVVAANSVPDEYIYCDCSAESPLGRRSLCYDHQALASRKANKPAGSAVGMADRMGTCLLTAEQYHWLQQVGPFDTKTSSWLTTPDSVRTLGGAIFGDYRYGRVFIYHNGAESYYAARGFRVCVSL